MGREGDGGEGNGGEENGRASLRHSEPNTDKLDRLNCPCKVLGISAGLVFITFAECVCVKHVREWPKTFPERVWLCGEQPDPHPTVWFGKVQRRAIMCELIQALYTLELTLFLSTCVCPLLPI